VQGGGARAQQGAAPLWAISVALSLEPRTLTAPVPVVSLRLDDLGHHRHRCSGRARERSRAQHPCGQLAWHCFGAHCQRSRQQTRRHPRRGRGAPSRLPSLQASLLLWLRPTQLGPHAILPTPPWLVQGCAFLRRGFGALHTTGGRHFRTHVDLIPPTRIRTGGGAHQAGGRRDSRPRLKRWCPWPVQAH